MPKSHAYNCPKDGYVVTCIGEGTLLTGRCPHCGTMYEVKIHDAGPGPSYAAGHSFGPPGGVAQQQMPMEADDDALDLDEDADPSLTDVVAALADQVVSLNDRVAALEKPEASEAPPAEKAPTDGG